MYGTSRGRVNSILYDAVVQDAKVRIVFDHKLIDIDFSAKSLVFETRDGGMKQRVTIHAKDARLLAADGCYSMVRRQMEKKVGGFEAKMMPWTKEFRGRSRTSMFFFLFTIAC